MTAGDAQALEDAPRGGEARRAAYVGAVFLFVGALLASRVPLCPVAMTIHRPCPGCGLTRATIAILTGDVGRAFELHPLAFAVSPLFALWAGLAAWGYVKTGRAELPKRAAGPIYVGLAAAYVALIALWIARFAGFWGGPVPV